ncbi:4-alpha-glucanotransferase [Bordetella tumbae]|uniref:4-alpha-glucanotransferase n=1 Tax=Bordetella tumbae TaxID=1649139 RepID=UPI0039EFC2C3
MSDAAARDLSALARRCGLQEHWIDAHRQARRVGPEQLHRLLRALGVHCESADDVAAAHAALDATQRGTPALLVARAGYVLPLPQWRDGPADLVSGADEDVHPVTLESHAQGAQLRLPIKPGYYELRQAGQAAQRLAVTPRAPDMDALLGRSEPRSWGVMAQVYSLRETHLDPVLRTWGHGDLATVASLAKRLGSAGADVLALNPLHAMFSADPAACSPYSPSNRLFLNVLYAAPAQVLGEAAVRQALDSLPPKDWAALDQGAEIHWPRAAAARLQVLRRLHEQFATRDASLQRDYRSFCEQQGQPLRDHAVFEALHTFHIAAAGQIQPCTTWDKTWRDPRSRHVRDFADHHAKDVDFHCFTQWLAMASLAHAQATARNAGMGIGLLSDLAVGVSPAGSQVWSDPDSFLHGVSIGAPPDIHQPRGQSWALSALSPSAMQRRGYDAFIGVLRAALARTGGTRIDHILGMERLWLVPEDGDPADGAYLHLPVDALLGLIALEAWRHRSLVIGENLGTVPAGFDDRLRDHGIGGMNVLWFMRDSEAESAPFMAPEQWPRDAAALTTTHDLPTLMGWWHGTDIHQRRDAGRLSPEKTATQLLTERQADKLALWSCFGDGSPLPASAPLPAMLAFVASAPCALALASLEDIAGLDEGPNVPGTTVEFPNWRRRLPGNTMTAMDSPPWRDRLLALRQTRERS